MIIAGQVVNPQHLGYGAPMDRWVAGKEKNLYSRFARSEATAEGQRIRSV